MEPLQLKFYEVVLRSVLSLPWTSDNVAEDCRDLLREIREMLDNGNS